VTFAERLKLRLERKSKKVVGLTRGSDTVQKPGMTLATLGPCRPAKIGYDAGDFEH
jgi:hypothetical protein